MKEPKKTAVRVAVVTLIAALVGVGYYRASDIHSQVPTPNGVQTITPQLFAFDGSNDKPAVTAPQPTPSRTPVFDNASRLARYDRLAKSNNPADNKLAYDMVQRCRDAKWIASRDPSMTDIVREECGDLVMRPGIIDDPAFQLALIERAAQAGVHRAYIDYFKNEYKRGRMGPPTPETEAHFEELRQIALSTADPYALAEEYARAGLVGDKEAELALFVAYRTAYARDNNHVFNPATDPATRARAQALPEAAAKAAIARGTQYVASVYKPSN